eukprot:1180671-Prorocentrum_minimum.AAC.8
MPRDEGKSMCYYVSVVAAPTVPVAPAYPGGTYLYHNAVILHDGYTNCFYRYRSLKLLIYRSQHVRASICSQVWTPKCPKTPKATKGWPTNAWSASGGAGGTISFEKK